jgi:hypothetical protein
MKTVEDLEKELKIERMVLRYALRELNVNQPDKLIERVRDDVRLLLEKKENYHV